VCLAGGGDRSLGDNFARNYVLAVNAMLFAVCAEVGSTMRLAA